MAKKDKNQTTPETVTEETTAPETVEAAEEADRVKHDAV